MKIVSDKIYLSTLPNNKVAICFMVDNRYMANRIVNEMQAFEKIQVDVKKFSNTRSLNQNDMMWAVIAKVSDYINGERSQESLDKIYGEILTSANIKRDLVAVLPNALPVLKSTFRAVLPTGQTIESINEKTGKKATLLTCWVYQGSSTYTTKEMGELLDQTLKYALSSGVSAVDIEIIRSGYEVD